MKAIIPIATFAAGFALPLFGSAGIKCRLATVDEGRALIAADDGYVERLTPTDLRLRMGREGATVADYKAFAADQVLPFSEWEAQTVSNAFDRVAGRLASAGFKNPLTNDVLIVMTTMREEFGAGGYTRGSTIYIGSKLVYQHHMMLDVILAHELFHVLSRQSPEFRRKMYSAIGFTICDEPGFSPEVREHIVSNPDVERYDCKGVFTIDGKPTEATVVLYLPDIKTPPKRFFRKIRAGIVPVSQPDRVLMAEDVPDFRDVVGRNTDYVFGAEECLADNFSYAVTMLDTPDAISSMKSPEILRRIISALKSDAEAVKKSK